MPITLWSNTDAQQVGNELDRLFKLQDRPLTNDKKDILVSELEARRFPPGAVIAGIRSLVDEDLKTIKLTTLKEATRKFILNINSTLVDCDHCNGSGTVEGIKNGPLYEHKTHLACVCETGKMLSDAHIVVRWNGQFRQQIGKYFVEFPDVKKPEGTVAEEVEWQNA